MTRDEALEILRSGVELTETQRKEIAAAIENAEIYNDWTAWEASEVCW